ncbi:transposase [Streptomyces sp. NBC_01343]|uniref:transposase n=1 Tax=Streptomyces sp. NBC_01343 TaxID=2903832 RepID=UPI002E11E5DB|nr:transposase [Streptomyces sp. NBC_01343]
MDEAEAEVLPLRLITDVLTTEATVPDVKATRPVQQNLADRGLTPGEHYLDAGYPPADLIHDATRQGTTMVTPALLDHSPQAKADAGFQKSAFRIDWKARQARCPQGRTSTGWFPVRQHDRDAIVVQYARTDCHACPAQDKCTTSVRGTRLLSLCPKELHETLADARAEQATKPWKTKCALRAGIEGTINQALDVTGLRRARYRGLPKIRLRHAFSATAVNVIRLDAHWNPGQPSFTPRISRLTRLSRQLAARTPKGVAPALGPRNTRLQLRLARP